MQGKQRIALWKGGMRGGGAEEEEKKKSRGEIEEEGGGYTYVDVYICVCVYGERR